MFISAWVNKQLFATTICNNTFQGDDASVCSHPLLFLPLKWTKKVINAVLNLKQNNKQQNSNKAKASTATFTKTP